jgi:GH24 family phage-related lysozyme (muramidase)
MLFTGVIEDRNDPLKLGRCKVRIVGLHTHDVAKLPTTDLPWAIPVQPITSAAISGIGQSPIGLVEGSWVVVMFQDEDKQYPIIIGSIGGIPQTTNDISVDDSAIQIKIDGQLHESNTQSDVPVEAPVVEEVVLQNTNKLKRAAEFVASNACTELIKRFEGLRLSSYQDSIGKWTIGYGTTAINDQPVVEGMTITKLQAEQYLLSDLNTKFAPTVQRNTRALISQSMFDALCCFTYNVGGGNFNKSSILKDLNASKYLDAAAGFMQWTKAGGVELAGLVKRRSAEKDLFLAEGVPNVAGELPPTTQSAQSQGVTEGISTTGSTQPASSTQGFVDPNGKYPLYFNEPDTNRLARHEEINKTIVYKKEAAIDQGVEIPNGTWDQSPIPYNAQYPFNHVMQTESGHVLEFDDTPNSERIHMYHKSGTFTEIDANGTQVNRIVGDGYEILERNGYVHINGSLNVTVDGAQNLYVKNALNMNVDGAARINIFNNANIAISGNANLSVGETFAVKAGAVKIEGDTVDIKSNGDLNIQASGEGSVSAGGAINVDGSRVNLGMGANAAASSGLESPGEMKSPEMPEMNTLTVITRGSSASESYETPEEGDPTQYQQRQIVSGAVKAEDIGNATKTDEVRAPASVIAAGNPACDIIYNTSVFDPAFKLSNNFSLSALTKNGSRPVVAQQGLTMQEIVCNLKGLAENCLEPIRNLYPNMILTSGFRRPGDVAASSKTSDHYLGCAADIMIPSLGRAGHYDAIQKIQQLIPYDQLLLEYQGSSTVWIHVSFKYKNNKKQVFTMKDHSRISDFGSFVLVA